nr:immunoglobulin light chain junction region [Macaca mulatta]MOY04926.1 immunoglobulin light chain junction region [Macaca mulatta]MOY05385.1 immunoglobulin light chain junction region [Macaca mulatta]MOY05545.1 immunoglobulin light chain junction region [Macaca mulatta]MOY05918.1 immunoglobulin light chain junction region [Macaca mulatta]
DYYCLAWNYSLYPWVF